MIARCTSSVCARSRISASRGSENVSVDHGATLSRSRCATTGALTPPCPVNFERIVSAETSSPMNRHRSAGAIRNANARAAVRANDQQPANANHKNIASCRSMPLHEQPPRQPRHQRAERRQLKQLRRLIQRRLAQQRLIPVIETGHLRPHEQDRDPAIPPRSTAYDAMSQLHRQHERRNDRDDVRPNNIRRNNASRRIHAAGPRTSEIPAANTRRRAETHANQPERDAATQRLPPHHSPSPHS